MQQDLDPDASDGVGQVMRVERGRREGEGGWERKRKRATSNAWTAAVGDERVSTCKCAWAHARALIPRLARTPARTHAQNKVFIKSVVPGGACDRDGSIQVMHGHSKHYAHEITLCTCLVQIGFG
jgi:hypothetical protein